MKMRKHAIKAGLLGLVVIAGSQLAAQPASANSASSSYPYPGGDVLQANAWIQSFSWTGCGNWSTSARLLGFNPPLASWIKNIASFHADGWGASLSGISASGGGSSQSLSWTNYNNWESDLAGRVCGNWLTWYIEESSTAISYVPRYGSPRTTIAAL